MSGRGHRRSPNQNCERDSIFFPTRNHIQLKLPKFIEIKIIESICAPDARARGARREHGRAQETSVVTGTEKEPPRVAAKASEGAATGHGEATAGLSARAVGRRGDQAARLAEAGAACPAAGG